MLIFLVAPIFRMATRKFYICCTKKVDVVFVSEPIGPRKHSCKAAFKDDVGVATEIMSIVMANTQGSHFHLISRKCISHVSYSHGTITW